MVFVASPALAQDAWFSESEAASIETVDHTFWDKLLASLVLSRETVLAMIKSGPSVSSSRMLQAAHIKKGIDINYVPYEFVKAEYADVLFLLQLYVDEMRHVYVSRLNRNEQLAYWLNLRNALVMLTLFSNLPVSDAELQDFYFGQSAENAHFDTKMLWVEGKLLSIRDIEENVVLANWDDPRILYGFYYGAKGGPFIMNQAFTGAKVFAQLEENARAYLNATKTIKVSKKTGLEVPLVFQWHSELFNNDPGVILGHLKLYANKKLSKKLEKAPAGKITYAFDWALNDIPPRVGQINVADFLLNANSGPGCLGSSSSSCYQNTPAYFRARAARRE